MSAAFFDVRPRYTAGSGAMVDERTARKVAAEERDAYEAALLGVYGEAERTKAEREGLSGIAIYMKETRTGWLVFDLITERWSEWPFVATCEACGRKRVRCNRGVLEPHSHTAYGACKAGGTYVGRDVTDTDQYRGKTL